MTYGVYSTAMTDEAPVMAKRPRSARGQGQQLGKELVLAATEQLAASGSADRLTLRGVGRAVGVSAASIYDHFADLAALVDAVVERGWQDLGVAVDAAVAVAGAGDGTQGVLTDPAAGGQKRPARRLGACARAYVRWAQENPGLYCVLFSRGLSAAPASPADREANRLLRLLDTCVRECRDSSTPTDPPLQAGNGMWVVLHGVSSLLIEKPGFDAAVADAVVSAELAHWSGRPVSDFEPLTVTGTEDGVAASLR